LAQVRAVLNKSDPEQYAEINRNNKWYPLHRFVNAKFYEENEEDDFSELLGLISDLIRRIPRPFSIELNRDASGKE